MAIIRSNNEHIVRKAIECFDSVWRSSGTVNLLQELKEQLRLMMIFWRVKPRQSENTVVGFLLGALFCQSEALGASFLFSSRLSPS